MAAGVAGGINPAETALGISDAAGGAEREAKKIEKASALKKYEEPIIEIIKSHSSEWLFLLCFRKCDFAHFGITVVFIRVLQN